MATKANNSDSFVGKWQTESDVIPEISKAGEKLKVRAFDKQDNDEIAVSKIVWNGKCLRFETFVPSTKFRARNCLTLVSKNKLVQELTFWETWKKI
jgi:hypothetical protein